MSVKVFGAAALMIGVAHAASANIHNKCDFDVTLVPSHEGSDQGNQTIKAGKSFSAPADGSAWCMKLYGPDATNPTQLEFSTWQPSPGQTILSYDLSNIDMHQDTTFLKYGMSLTSDDPSCKDEGSTCKPATCGPDSNPNPTPCTDAYNEPYDPRTLGASASYDINMDLCTGGDDSGFSGSSGSSGSSDSSDSSSQAPAPASSSAPASSQQYTAAPQSQTTMATSVSAAAQQYSAQPSVQAASDSGPVPLQADKSGNVFEGSPGSNVVTTWVANTAMVTKYVTARDAEPTAVLDRRHAHEHGHSHHQA